MCDDEIKKPIKNMIKQNMLIVKPVVQFTVAFAAMAFAPQYWGGAKFKGGSAQCPAI